MKKHNLVRAIQYLEKHCGLVHTSAQHDMIYLSITTTEFSLHRLKRLQLINLFTEECLELAEADGLTHIEVDYFTYYT
jgi:hypothetical protein